MRWLPAALVLALLGTAVGCDSGGGDDDDDPESIDGLWESRGQDVFYLEIDTDAQEIVIHDYYGDDFDDFDDCYVTINVPILDVDGNVYTLLVENSDGEDEEAEARLRVENGVLLSTTTDNDGSTEVTERYDRSDRNVSEFEPECEFGDGGDSSLRGPARKGAPGFLR